MLTLSKEQWIKIKSKLATEYPPSVTMISWKTKEVLGFTVRHKEEWKTFDVSMGNERKILTEMICLDFYDEVKETWFRLKYL